MPTIEQLARRLDKIYEVRGRTFTRFFAALPPEQQDIYRPVIIRQALRLPLNVEQYKRLHEINQMFIDHMRAKAANLPDWLKG